MKPSTYRRIRRRTAGHEAASFKKDNQQEQSFFGETMHEPFFKPVTAMPQSAAIQRKCDGCEKEEKKQQAVPEKKEEEKKLQKKSDGMEKKEEDKKLQKKSDGMEKKEEEKKLQKKDAGGAPTAVGSVGSYVGTLSSKGQPIPAQANNFFSSRIGYDFSHVKIHTGKEAADSAKAVHAKAYTIGNHIVFNEGQFNYESDAGKRLMAHELAHVMQQDAGETLKRKSDAENMEEEITWTPTFFARGEQMQNTRHFADCNGVSVQGFCDANYGESYSSPGSSAPARNCDGCADEECVTNTGTVVSVFTANPQITLPSVPDGLNECEQTAVSNFINTTLRAHEQQHVAAFNGYRGTVRTPYTYRGCAGGLDDHTRQIHERIEAARKASSDAASAALDANGANIFNVTCTCPDPAPPETTTE